MKPITTVRGLALAMLVLPIFQFTSTGMLQGRAQCAEVGSRASDLTNALSAAHSGACVAVPAGYYELSQTLELTASGVTVKCSKQGSVITGPTSVSPLLRIKGNSNKIAGCNFAGQAKDQSADQWGVEIVGRGNILERSAFGGADASSGLNIAILAADGSEANWIERNRITQVIGTTRSTGYGILLVRSNRNHLRNNHIVFSPVQGRHQIYVSQASSGNEVSGNILQGGTNSQVALYARDAQEPGCRGNVVTHNILSGNNAPFNSTGAVVIANNCSQNEITSNIISDVPNVSGIEITDAAGRRTPDENVVSGNVISKIGAQGILLAGGSNNLISTNSISQVSTSATRVYDAIQIMTNGEQAPARGNQILYNKVAGDVHRYPVSVVGTPPPIHTVIQWNMFDVGAYPRLWDRGIDSRVHGNGGLGSLSHCPASPTTSLIYFPRDHDFSQQR